MPKTTSQLPAGTANRNAVVAADNASATLTEKITLGDIASLASYRLSATTSGTTPAVLAGDSLTLEVGEAWQFEIKLVARNKKTDGTKVWSIRGGIRKSFGGAVALVGSLDTQTTGSIGGGSVSVTAQPAGLTITVTGVANTNVDWQATILTSEKTSTQQALVGGCTDPDVVNYNATADFDDGSCSYSAVPSSVALEPVASEDEIESLTVTVGANDLYPAFDPAIKDYYVKTSAAYLGNASYEIVINEGTPITGTIKAGRTLQINDGVSYYYVRVLPNDVAVGTVSLAPTEGYVPGYYLSAKPVGTGAPYYYVHDHRGVPVWYGRGSDATPFSTHLGKEANRLVLNTFNAPRAVLRLNASSVSRSEYQLITSPQYGSVAWELHDALELSAPQSRFGNLVGVDYTEGFYLQERTPAGDIVWEWHSKDYFQSQDPEFYHINSVDVHPVNGNVLVSLRNCSAIACIEYATKNVLWVLQGVPSPSYGTLQSQAIAGQTADTKWLTLASEPLVDGFQYAGPRAQHDARWRAGIAPLTAGNEVISLFDNQSEQFYGFSSSGAGPFSRGVVYEINLASSQATHRSSIFSEVGTSSRMGSYSIVASGSSLSHAINFVEEHPQLVEYVGGVASSKTKTFAMDFDDDIYRIIKVPTSSFRLDNLRATCGVDAGTGTLPAAGGGGGGGSTTLLLHFDGDLSDSSPTAAVLTAYNGAAISTSQSKFGGSSLFLDTTSYVDGDGTEGVLNFDGGAGTVEAWVRLTSHVPSGSYGGIVSPQTLANGSGLSYGLNHTGGVSSPACTFIDAGAGGGVGELQLNQWHHVAYTVDDDGVALRYFLDGVLESTTTLSGASDQLGVRIGNILPEALTGFVGYVDELRVVKGEAVYTDDFTPPTSAYTS